MFVGLLAVLEEGIAPSKIQRYDVAFVDRLMNEMQSFAKIEAGRGTYGARNAGLGAAG